MFTLDELQAAANGGGVGLICAQRRDLAWPGHICAVVPETAEHRAQRRDEVVSSPLQSQAGASNAHYRTAVWWSRDYFREVGTWVHG